jgi:peptidyl-prolyl cis-trans isomerase C
MKSFQKIILPAIAVILIAAACNPTPAPATPSASPTAVMTPTITLEPMAVSINGVGVTLAEYQQELLRLQDAQSQLGITSNAEEQKQKVLADLTDQLLLEQGATQGGYMVDDSTLQSRIEQLAADMGGQDRLTEWQNTNHYTPDTFAQAMRRSIAAAWQRDQIINSVPDLADEVHARQILVQTEGTAGELLAQLKAGADFATLAMTYDPTTGGDLGWFPQGYLLQPEVETAAFALQPGQYSEVIKSAIGYHIIYVIERDANHELTPDARRALQEKKLSDWLDAAKAASQIVIAIP